VGSFKKLPTVTYRLLKYRDSGIFCHIGSRLSKIARKIKAWRIDCCTWALCYTCM